MARRKQLKPPIDPHRARAECFLLCDFARSENGKLYIVGGGWDRIVPQKLPVDYEVYLAIKIDLPWEIIEPSAAIRIELMDKSGQLLGDPIVDTTIEGEQVDFIPPTNEANNQGILVATILMAVGVKMVLTTSGRFVLRLLVNAEPLAVTSFVVAPSPEADIPAEEIASLS